MKTTLTEKQTDQLGKVLLDVVEKLTAQYESLMEKVTEDPNYVIDKKSAVKYCSQAMNACEQARKRLLSLVAKIENPGFW